MAGGHVAGAVEEIISAAQCIISSSFFFAEAEDLLLEEDEEPLLLKIESPMPLIKAIAEVCLNPARNATAMDKAVMPT